MLDQRSLNAHQLGIAPPTLFVFSIKLIVIQILTHSIISRSEPLLLSEGQKC